MTVPEACEQVSVIFKQCVDSSSFLEKLQGKCESLKIIYEACMDQEVLLFK